MLQVDKQDGSFIYTDYNMLKNYVQKTLSITSLRKLVNVKNYFFENKMFKINCTYYLKFRLLTNKFTMFKSKFKKNYLNEKLYIKIKNWFHE